MDATKNFFVGVATFSTAAILGVTIIAFGAALIAAVAGV